MPTKSPIEVFNNNTACLCWSKSTTTKGLWHMSIRESAVRESVLDGTVVIRHIAGSFNIADIFTKELKDTATFTQIRDLITSIVPNSPSLSFSSE